MAYDLTHTIPHRRLKLLPDHRLAHGMLDLERFLLVTTLLPIDRSLSFVDYQFLQDMSHASSDYSQRFRSLRPSNFRFATAGELNT